MSVGTCFLQPISDIAPIITATTPNHPLAMRSTLRDKGYTTSCGTISHPFGCGSHQPPLRRSRDRAVAPVRTTCAMRADPTNRRGNRRRETRRARRHADVACARGLCKDPRHAPRCSPLLGLSSTRGAFVACGSSTPKSGFADTPARIRRAAASASGGSSGTRSAATTTARAGGGNQTGCSDAAKLVYVVSDCNELYSFKPDTGTFAKIGDARAARPSGATPNSMAVDRSGTAWVNFSDGGLFKVSTSDASCQATTFQKQQSGFQRFGMAFATNSATSAGRDALRRRHRGHVNGGKGLAKIDLDDDEAHHARRLLGRPPRAKAPSSPAPATVASSASSRREPNATLAQIDKATGATSARPGPERREHRPGVGVLVLGRRLLVLHLAAARSLDGHAQADEHRRQPLRPRRQDVGGFRIVGAGVSTCAPTTPPRRADVRRANVAPLMRTRFSRGLSSSRSPSCGAGCPCVRSAVNASPELRWWLFSNFGASKICPEMLKRGVPLEAAAARQRERRALLPEPVLRAGRRRAQGDRDERVGHRLRDAARRAPRRLLRRHDASSTSPTSASSRTPRTSGASSVASSRRPICAIVGVENPVVNLATRTPAGDVATAIGNGLVASEIGRGFTVVRQDDGDDFTLGHLEPPQKPTRQFKSGADHVVLGQRSHRGARAVTRLPRSVRGRRARTPRSSSTRRSTARRSSSRSSIARSARRGGAPTRGAQPIGARRRARSSARARSASARRTCASRSRRARTTSSSRTRRRRRSPRWASRCRCPNKSAYVSYSVEIGDR